MRNRMIVVGLVVLTLVFSGIYYIDEVLEFLENFSLSGLVGLAAIASGVSAVIMSILSIRTDQFEANREYFFKGDSEKMMNKRRQMYLYEMGEVILPRS